MIHLISNGVMVMTAGKETLGTWCGKPVGYNDVNKHALSKVTCTACLKKALETTADRARGLSVFDYPHSKGESQPSKRTADTTNALDDAVKWRTDAVAREQARRSEERITCPYCKWEFAVAYYDSTHVPCPEGPR